MSLKSVLVVGLLLSLGCASKAPAKKALAPTKPAAVVETKPTPAPASVAPATPAAQAPVVTEVAKEDSPTVVIQKYTEELKSIVEPTKSKDKTKRDTVKEHQIAEKVRQFFDFEGLARASLNSHWNAATPAQRKEYMDLFISLIEDSYLRKTRDLVGEYQIVYEKEAIEGGEAKVYSRVVRNDADVDIRYELHRNPKNWMIYNIDLDGVDLIQNYQSQFNKIIQQSNISGLLDKLRKKWNEIKNGNS